MRPQQHGSQQPREQARRGRGCSGGSLLLLLLLERLLLMSARQLQYQ